LVMFAACQKQESSQMVTVLSATVEQQSEPSATKTILEGGAVKWVENDLIKVFDNAGKGAKYTAQSEGTSTTFDGPTDAEAEFSASNLSCAIYPYSAATCSGTTITFSLPATQTYAANSFGQDANVAVGTVSGSSISFKNVCGALKLQLKGSMKVKKIVLTSTDNLWGTFSVDASTASTTGAAYVSGGGTSLTLDCSNYGVSTIGAASGGVQLDSQTATNFYFVVPVGALAVAFSATIYDAAGDTYFATLNAAANSNNTIVRTTITAMPSKAVSLLPAGFAELQYIENTTGAYSTASLTGDKGGAFINTKIFAKETDAVEIAYLINEDATFSDTEHFNYYSEQGCAYYAIFYALNSDYATTLKGFAYNICLYANVFTNGKQYKPHQNFDFTSTNQTNLKYTLVFDPQHRKYKLNDVTWTDTTTEGFSGTLDNSLYLFNMNRDEPYYMGYPFKGKIYYFRYYDNGTIVNVFIPAKVTTTGKTDVDENSVSVGTVGMYDIISGKFFVNQSPNPSSYYFTADSPVLAD